MQNYLITFENGDHFSTGFNGGLEAAKAYYLGRIFNLGTDRDDLQRCNCVEPILSEQEKVAEALANNRPVFITDGTVTRQAVAALNGDAFRMDDGMRCWVSWEQFGAGGNMALYETEDGLYIAPSWWKKPGA